MEIKTVLVDNLICSYTQFRGYSPYEVLFLHGRGRSKKDWESYFFPLQQKGVSYIALDFPGFGGSEFPSFPRGVEEYGNFILYLSQKLSDSLPKICVAHSFGGRIAFNLGATHPTFFQKLILCAPGGVEQDLSHQKKNLISLSKKFFSLPGLSGIGEKIKQKVGSADYQNAGAMKEIFVKVVNEDLRHFFPSLQIPTEIFRGTDDNQILSWQIDEMEKLIPNVQMHRLSGLDHDVHIHASDQILPKLFSL